MKKLFIGIALIKQQYIGSFFNNLVKIILFSFK